MNNLDTYPKRILINALFGSGILLILALTVMFRYYIDKQNLSIKSDQNAKQLQNYELRKI